MTSLISPTPSRTNFPPMTRLMEQELNEMRLIDIDGISEAMVRRFNRASIRTVMQLRREYDSLKTGPEFTAYLVRVTRCTRRQADRVLKAFSMFRLQDELDHNEWLDSSYPMDDLEFDRRMAVIADKPYVPYTGFAEYIEMDGEPQPNPSPTDHTMEPVIAVATPIVMTTQQPAPSSDKTKGKGDRLDSL